MKNFAKGKKTIIRDSIANEFGISLSRQAIIHGVSRNMMSLIHRNKRSDKSKSVEVLSAFALANQKVTTDSILEFKRSFENSFIEHKKKWIQKKLDDLDFKRQGLEKKRDRIQLKYDVLCAQLLRCEGIDTSTISNARKGESLKKHLA